MKKITQSMLLATALFWSVAQAGTQALGFELGVSTVDQVRANLAKRTNVQDNGTNKFSNGAMLKTDGSGYDLEGLNSVLYIFDDQRKLSGIIMDMAKHRFDPVYNALSNKYKLSTQQRAFVGNQFARFKTQDAVVEIDAPHMSFEMEVRYIKNELFAKFKSQSSAEAEDKKKRESAKF